MTIAVLEPYYGGSHKAFFDSLAGQLDFNFEFHTMPARKWKWRMRLAAPCFAEDFRRRPDRGEGVSAILCSPFLDVATFRGLAPACMRQVPVFTYFHENQFAYPVQVDDQRDFHFSLTNLTTALASDSLAFNSQYNLDSFLAGVEKVLPLIHDMDLPGYEEKIRRKSVILYPGLDFSEIDQQEREQEPGKGSSPVIVWNHRWEHDKNPEFFFKSLFELDARGVDFSLIVMGQSFRRQPEIFEEARQRLSHRIIHYGYAESRQEYIRLLKQGDIVVSTANHEFYGISVIEAVRAGCRPLLPNRLSYPELFDRRFLYEDRDFTGALAALLNEFSFSEDQGRKMTEQFSWSNLQAAYHGWLNDCL